MKTRATAAWLCAAMILSAAASSCGTPAEQPVETPQKETVSDTEAVTGETDKNADALAKAKAELPQKNYDGYTFTVLDRAGDTWGTIDVFSEAENGDTINDAVFKRNRILEEAFNIHIAQKQEDKPGDEARTLITADDAAFDVVTDGLNTLGTLASAGCLYDWNEVPGIDLSQPWWDPQASKELSIRNKLFFTTGDISIMDNYGTWCIMFNKSIAQDYDLDDIYEHVRKGTWTISLFYEMAKTAAKDMNGDGVISDEDQWGYFSETYNEYGMWAASGETIIKKDKDDLPVLNVLNDRSISVLQLVTEMQQNAAVTLSTERVKDGTGSAFTNNGFGNGSALFIYGGMWLITYFRKFDLNFGVVPAPKFEESQERYYNTYSYGNCTAYGIPVTCRDFERLGTVLEAMAQISKYTLTPAYYDVALKGKYIRDEESAEMLDIILAQRTYDLGNIFDWGGMFSTITGFATAKSPNFASAYAKKESAVQKAIGTFLESLDTIE